MIVLDPFGSTNCIRFHTIGGNPVYTRAIEPDKRFDSESVKSTEFFCKIQADGYTKVVAQAMAIPAQSCQRWARYLIWRLELLGWGREGYSDDLGNSLTAKNPDLGAGCVKDFRRVVNASLRASFSWIRGLV
ncbi:hypothetical protein N7486_004555 [Penicillium sp. IBT 16267x]|nr:hypothetical protein N7486_004555 [Penicillium sp. IBT 16267x]